MATLFYIIAYTHLVYLVVLHIFVSLLRLYSSYTCYKISIAPKLSSPQFLLYLRMFGKYSLCSYAFDYSYDFLGTLAWHWLYQKNVHDLYLFLFPKTKSTRFSTLSPYMFTECIHPHFHLSLRDDILLDTQSGTQDLIRYVIDDNNCFPVPLPVVIPSKDIIHLQFTGVCTALWQ